MSKSNSGRSAAIKKDEFDPIKNFQPMPKRFIVWDTLHEDWRKCKLPGSRHWGYVFELHQLSVFLVNASNNGLPHTRFKIFQSTGLFDEDGEEIFEGSVVRDFDEAIGAVYYDTEEGGYWANSSDGDSFELADSSCDLKVLGHILSNPELLEEKDD